jgi:type IV pilus assembly protein PilO
MQILEKLQERPWYFQFTLFSVIGLLVFILFYHFVTKSVRASTTELEQQVKKLQKENAQAQIASQRINEFRANYETARHDYEELKALLPEQRELTTVLQGLQERARNRLTVRRFTPKDDIQQDYFSGKPIEVEVSGSYNNIGEFFAQMAAYQRIVSITDFKVIQSSDQYGGRSVDGQFNLTAYYASPEKLKSGPATKGKKKGKKEGKK